jgi:hypothetical protein
MKFYRSTDLIVVILLALSCSACCPISQRKLEADFPARRNDLEKLAEMAREDAHLTRVAEDFTWLEDNMAWPRPENSWGLTRQRWDRYRDLFRSAEVPDGFFKRGDGIYFVDTTCGLSISGSASGYVYSENPPGPIVETFDGIQTDSTLFIRLTEDWYLFYDSF